MVRRRTHSLSSYASFWQGNAKGVLREWDAPDTFSDSCQCCLLQHQAERPADNRYVPIKCFLIRILKSCQKKFMETSVKKLPLIRITVCPLAWGGFCSIWQTADPHLDWWKQLCAISADLLNTEFVWLAISFDSPMGPIVVGDVVGGDVDVRAAAFHWLSTSRTADMPE